MRFLPFNHAMSQSNMNVKHVKQKLTQRGLPTDGRPR